MDNTLVKSLLGRVLLWCVYDRGDQTKAVQEFIATHIKDNYDKVVTDKRLADEEYPVAKVPLYIIYCVAGDQNGNLILEAMIESIDKEVNKNKIKEEKVKRLKNQYKQKNLNEYQSI